MLSDNSKVKRAKKVVDAGMNIPLALLQESIDLNDKLEQLVAKDTHQMELPKEIETIFKSVAALKGDKGEKGDKGDTGNDGKNGLDGKDGKDGYNGINGMDGVSGRDGADGKDGLNGKDGKNGKDGSPDTPDQVIDKVNKSNKKISSTQILGLAESFDKLSKSVTMGGVQAPILDVYNAGVLLKTRVTKINFSSGATLASDTVNVSTGGGGSMAIGGSITSATQGSVLFAGASGVLAQDNTNFFFDDTNDRLGIKTSAPTHSITIGSTGNGYVNYNTADQTTNYERLVLKYVSNEALLGTEFGGTGAIRTFRIGAGGTAGGDVSVGRTLDFNASTPFYKINASTGIAGNLFDFSSVSISGASVTQSLFAVNGVINQSGTSSFNSILVNPTLTATGTGTKNFLNLQVAGVTTMSFGIPTSQPAWGTAGVAISQVAGTYTDNSTAISGTVALGSINTLGTPTIAATNATVTYSDAATLLIGNAPQAGTNVTITRGHAIYVSAGFITGNGGLRTSNQGLNPIDNFWANGGITSASGFGTGGFLVEGAAATTIRASVHGTTGGIGANNNYISFVVGQATIAEAATGNHPLIASMVVRAPTITGGAATVSNTATLYIDAAPSATVSDANSPLWVASGVTRFGKAGTALGQVRFDGSTSGFTTLQPQAVAGAYVVTLPPMTGTLATYATTTEASNATPTVAIAGIHHIHTITALAVGATFGVPTIASGTLDDNFKLMIRIKDNGTARALAFNAIFRAIGVTLPTTTVIGKTMYLGCNYNVADTKWDVVAYTIEA